MRDWDDLRFFLSVATHGSTLAASAALGASQSTVFRRIGALEAALGVALFDRRASGYTPTAAGEALLPIARRIAGEVEAFAEAAAREGRRQTTVIRFSAPDGAMEHLLPPVMVGFRAQYPDVRIEIVTSDRKVDLASGEADVALRANPSSDAALFGRRLCLERPALTASRAYAERHPLPAIESDVAQHAFIGLTGVLADLLADWSARNVPPERVLVRPDNIASTLTAVRSGLGIAVLPQFLSDRDPSLVAAPLPLPIAPFEMWIVAHERLRRTPAVRALMDAIAEYVIATTPRRPDAPPAPHDPPQRD